MDITTQYTCKVGNLTFDVNLNSGWVRRVRTGRCELIQAIYPAVRDPDWGTVPNTVEQVDLQHTQGQIQIRLTGHSYQSHYGIDLRWEIWILAQPPGTLIYQFTGEAAKTFEKNRIGICLHLPANLAGTPCKNVAKDGTIITGTLPRFISPHQPYTNISSFSFAADDKHWCHIGFSGDIFEMEDQRNWTDASYKIYSTPLSLPFPVRVEAGWQFSQSVTILIEPFGSSIIENRPGFVGIHIQEERAPVPPLGTVCPPLIDPNVSIGIDEATTLLKRLDPDHLRIDIDLADQDTAKFALENACALAKATDIPLHVALFTTGTATQLDFLTNILQVFDSLPIEAWLIFDPNEKTTPPRLLDAVTAKLNSLTPAAHLAVGTDYFFAELNRGYHPWPQADWLVFSINPTVHVNDEESLLENADIQNSTIETIQQWPIKKDLLISPVTLRPRNNPNATRGNRIIPREQQFDPRIGTVFGAAWFLRSLQSLGIARTAKITYFEAFGPLGMIQTDSLQLWRNTPLANLFQIISKAQKDGAYINKLLVTGNQQTISPLFLSTDHSWILLLANPWRIAATAIISSLPKTAKIICTHIFPDEQTKAGSVIHNTENIIIGIPPESIIILEGTSYNKGELA